MKYPHHNMRILCELEFLRLSSYKYSTGVPNTILPEGWPLYH